jgi:hypothetical protein
MTAKSTILPFFETTKVLGYSHIITVLFLNYISNLIHESHVFKTHALQLHDCLLI